MSYDYPVDMELDDRIRDLKKQGYHIIYGTRKTNNELYSVCTPTKEVVFYKCNTDIKKLDMIEEFIRQYGIDLK